MRLAIGNYITFSGSPGIGRVAEVNGDRVRVEFFESPAQPVAESVWIAADQARRVSLSKQTRVFFRSGRERWRAGRIVGGGPVDYFVRVPNLRFDLQWPEADLRVRWEKPPRDPLQVLLSGANETPRYRDVREPVRRLLLAERAATASATGITSAGVSMHGHQIGTALRIIRDPIQRYLLADEVGMGKTIQAGFVMRQLLIDAPGRTIGAIVPDALALQWSAELRDKFYLDDFPTSSGQVPCRILGHGDVQRWRELKDVDLLVVDEAHLLARTDGPSDSPYRDLADVAHAVPRILMLSATPFSRGVTTHLALLHLLDPQLFRWEDRERFAQLLDARRELALAVFGLDDPDPDNPGLLKLQFAEILDLVPDDHVLQEAMQRALDLFGPPGSDPESIELEAIARAIDAVRVHLSETYRLHHRVIRNRRHVIEMQKLDDGGLITPFAFTGRTRPKVARLRVEEASAGASALGDWIARCSAAILDKGLDATPYALALGVIQSRVGGPVSDLYGILRYRVQQVEQPELTPAEKAALNAAPLLEFEADILEALAPLDGIEALDELARIIVRLCEPGAKAIVFCGRGRLAPDLMPRIPLDSRRVKHVWAHLSDQSEERREEATEAWRRTGGILVVDDSGDLGRNFQDANVVFHVRLPWNPNALEQRIGRVDRYGHQNAAQQFIIADEDPDCIPTAWIKVLSSGFGIFTESISALQEVVDDLAIDTWRSLLTDGIEAFVGRIESIGEALRKERRRINELDALEVSFGSHADGHAMVKRIAIYEADPAAIEQHYRHLIEGVEGYRFESKTNLDGSIRFEPHYEDKPLLSDRLLRRLVSDDAARTGYFDRWRLAPGRRLFRRGNPFIDGLETLLDLDDSGQAAAMWRLDIRWPQDPFAFFGFDFLIEADVNPVLELLKEMPEVEPIARRRADAAFAPQHQRVWIPVNTRIPVQDGNFAQYLSLPLEKGRDVNLNLERIGALHSLLGGEANLAVVARGCYEAARQHVEVVADVVAASVRAADLIRRDTEMMLAQSRARARAVGLVTDPLAFEADVAMGRAIEAGVIAPVRRLSGVTCVVVSAQSWADYV